MINGLGGRRPRIWKWTMIKQELVDGRYEVADGK